MKLIIGIDPGAQTGLATWVPSENRFQTITTYSIIQAMNYCLLAIRDGIQIEIRFEDSRKRKWFGNAGREKLQGAGSIKRDCSIWQEFCEYHSIPFIAIAPQKGSTKWTSAYFKGITGYTGRTSEHSRDAACLVFGAN